MDITISYNEVKVEGVTLPKPPSMSSTAWMEFWEDVNRLPDILRDLEDAHDEIKSFYSSRE